MSTADNSTEQQQEDEVVESGQKLLLFSVIPSWMISFVGHVALILLLAFLALPKKKEITTSIEASATPGETVETIDLDMAEFDEMESEELVDSEFEDVIPVEIEVMDEMETFESPDSIETSDFVGAEELVFEDAAFGEIGSGGGETGELSGRSGSSKQAALKKFGGTDESEEAVQLALEWIVRHQLPDGGWSVDHTIGPGSHRDSPNPGLMAQARNGATALALLPLLGSGNTHKVGKYKDNVRAGLDFLINNASRGGRGVSFYEPGGSTYSHGLCSIAVCEAFALTKDRRLAPYAQGAIWFMEDYQEKLGGGWRYERPDAKPPTLSVASWQVMGLKSAKLSGFDIDERSWSLLSEFLTAQSSDEGSRYRYQATTKNPRKGMTAVGLLCRMYTGWDKDHPAIRAGVDYLDDVGPDVWSGPDVPYDIYYNYYATQVMKQYGGPEWETWNEKLRDNLIEAQVKEGNAAGSWYFADPLKNNHRQGGRLYTTALACMTLEVYYRFLPLYSRKSTSADFQFE